MTINLTRIHMEEDAGKLIHGDELGDPNHSYSDLNRAGVPLLEIVSEPELRNPEDAESYMRKLRTLVRYLGISDGNMQEGSLRCDANISLRPQGSEEFGEKVEIKNMNSFRNLRRALEYEEKRQRETLDSGGAIYQETRLWDESAGVTRGMRSKEYAHDYRYFPDPIWCRSPWTRNGSIRFARNCRNYPTRRASAFRMRSASPGTMRKS